MFCHSIAATLFVFLGDTVHVRGEASLCGEFDRLSYNTTFKALFCLSAEMSGGTRRYRFSPACGSGYDRGRERRRAVTPRLRQVGCALSEIARD